MADSILITGGAGFIGSRLAVALASRGSRVRVLDSLSPQIHGPDGDSPTGRAAASVAEIVRADVRDAEAVGAALKGMDAVVHLAAETGTGQSMYEIGRYTDVNVLGTGRLLDAITAAGGAKRIVVASSRAIYGEGKYVCAQHGTAYPGSRREVDLQEGRFDPLCGGCGRAMQPVPTDEESVLHPTSIYGITKQCQEQMAVLFGESSGIPAIALRYQNAYGPGQSLKNPYTGILSIFSTRFRAGGDLNIFEDGRESRDFVYIDDVVTATIAALDAPAEVRGAFNIGSGAAVDVLTVASTLKEKLGRGGAIRVTGNFRSGDIRHNFADIQRAQAQLSWRPATTFEDGIQRFVSWVETQEPADDSYERSLNELKARGMLQ